ncbi:hypothetical protein BDU57DRAFT_205496 [Ampelomyces quisqualis]|uniref:Uncharacterized protein n=1 Tax=Ampelomyces quisqualis TaxID=50730 RepID=A0A6A5QP07_AMPQU|nr:hypothetical protein BDU57DRAFT_205496 [Ampelomyces quisqualis]
MWRDHGSSKFRVHYNGACLQDLSEWDKRWYIATSLPRPLIPGVTRQYNISSEGYMGLRGLPTSAEKWAGMYNMYMKEISIASRLQANKHV